MHAIESVKPIKPIFILGAGRSGTSVITLALRKGAQIPGFNEGHFLPLLKKVLAETDRYFESKKYLLENRFHMIAHVDKADLEDGIISLFREAYQAICEEEVWIDKTPDVEMIEMVPYLKRLWPEARYIFAKRRGIENIISRCRKFPHVDFEGHCITWATCMESWLISRADVSEASIEIEQRDIALYPLATAQTIGDFLNLEVQEIQGIHDIFAKKRPQSTSADKETENALDIKEIGWTKEQIKVFRNHCGEVSEKMGYSETASYYANRSGEVLALK